MVGKTYTIPKWMKLTGAAIPIIAFVWIVIVGVDNRFMNEAEATETHEQIVQQIQSTSEAIITRIEDGEQKSAVKDIEIRLEVINVELSWLSNIEEEDRSVYQVRRMDMLQTQLRILMERYEDSN